MSARDRAVVAIAVALGLLLGGLAAWRPSDVEALARWLRRGTATIGPPAPAATVVTVLPDAPHEDRDVLWEVRSLVREGRIGEARKRLLDHGMARGGAVAVALQVEAASLTLLADPEGFDASMAAQSRALLGAAPPPWDLGEVARLLLEHVPEGLGQPADPGRAHARAYVAAVLVRAGGASHRRETTAALAPLVDDDVGRLVDVIEAWNDLRPHVEAGDVLVNGDRVRRDVATELCQALLDTSDDIGPLCDALAGIARDGACTPRERAVAALALAELADLPIGLGAGLPRDDADAAGYPVAEIAAAWEGVRGLPAGVGFRARVALALDEVAEGPSRASPWLALRLGGGPSPPDVTAVAEGIAVGETQAEQHLAGLAEGATTPREIVRRMASEEQLALALHHLLVLRGLPEEGRAPRFVASSDWSGVPSAWRRALGLHEIPFTVRVARLERRLDALTLRKGLRLLDEERRVVRPGEVAEMTWSQTFDHGTDPEVGWRAPGSLQATLGLAQMTETLRVRVEWADAGAQVRLDDLDVSIQHARGSGSSSTSGLSWPVGLPVALAPWSDTPSTASRRVHLVFVTEGGDAGAPWTRDDWSAAMEGAFHRLQDEAAATATSRFRGRHAFWMLGEGLALLRPEGVIERLRAEGLDVPGIALRNPGPGIGRVMTFAGHTAWLVTERAGRIVPTQAAVDLASRQVAELALEAPDPDVRAVMWSLLDGETKPSAAVAEEILSVAEAEPGRVPPEVVEEAHTRLSIVAERSGRTVRLVVAGGLWFLVLVLLGTCVRLRRGRGGVGGTGVLLLAAALFVAQMDLDVAGWSLFPAWLGWGLAFLAVGWVAGDAAPAEARVFRIAAGTAAVASVAALFAGLAAEIVGAVAALAACLTVAPLAPALLRGLVPAGSTNLLPRAHPARGTWRTGARVVIPALLAGGAMAGATTLAVHEITEAALFYAPIATCFGGVVIWRVWLARYGTAVALPAPFVLGLLVPGLVLLVTETATRLSDGPSRELPEPFGPALHVWIFCALLFALVRLFDAARIRGTA